MIMAAHEAYVLLTPQEKTWLFSVDLETMRVEREHERNKYAGSATRRTRLSYRGRRA
jgi:hypothetical protein